MEVESQNVEMEKFRRRMMAPHKKFETIFDLWQIVLKRGQAFLRFDLLLQDLKGAWSHKEVPQGPF